MSRIQCFMLRPSVRARHSVRRYSHAECPLPQGYHYHNSSVELGVVDYPLELDRDGDGEPGPEPDLRIEPGWPTVCACGYTFTPDDPWQVNRTRLYVADDGREFLLSEAPPGAMWFADWYPEHMRGPDGHTLVVCCPPGGAGNHWIVDRAPRGGTTPWQRTGVPPNVTARPSILFTGSAPYHGFLNNGWLEEC